MDLFLHWWFQHIPTIIQWLILVIAVLCAMVVALGLFGREREPKPVGDLEETLKRVLSQTASLPAPPSEAAEGASSHDAPSGAKTAKTSGRSQAEKQPPPAGAPEAAAQPATTKKAAVESEELTYIREELAKKQKEIEQLKQQQQTQQQPANSEEIDSYLGKIKDLEDKLAEYEIIEDDIADLSHYRAENQKLKEELMQLKGGAVGEDEVRVAGAEAVAEETQVVGAAATEQDAAQVIGASNEPESTQVIASAASQENQGSQFVKGSQPEAEPGAQVIEGGASPAKAPSVQVDAPGDAEADDILAEFTSPSGEAEALTAEMVDELVSSVTTEASPSSVGIAAGDEVAKVDTEKMLEEMESLAQAAVNDDGTSGLEDELDVDKMAAEATKLAASDKQ